MPVLAVCNHKGGTGKTTSAIHLAAAFGLCGHRTLVIDLDPQGFLTRTLGVGEPAEEASSLALFEGNRPLGEIPPTRMNGFDLLPSSTNLTRAMRRLNKPTDVFWLKETIEAGHGYDHILLDTAAAVTVFSLNALVASRFCVIPVTPEYQPVLGAEQTYQTCFLTRDKLNPALAEPWFLLTKVDGRKRSHTLYRQYLRKHYGARVLQTIIRTSTSLSDTALDGRTIFDTEVNSRGALDYANAADELLRHMNAVPPARAVGQGELVNPALQAS